MKHLKLMKLKNLMKSKLVVLMASVAMAAVALPPAFAQTSALDVKNAWVRATVPGQSGTGAFMTLTHKTGAKLVRVSSSAVPIVEIHEMKMEGDVMKMRELPQGLDLPAGKPVELAPGGLHLMLMDLKTALQRDSTLPLTLWLRDAKGEESKIEITVPVVPRAPASKANTAGQQMDQHKH